MKEGVRNPDKKPYSSFTLQHRKPMLKVEINHR